ncbi:MAG: transposase [Alkaliphilus sp.]
MFKENPNNGQMSMFDPYYVFPGYIKDILHKSWAPYFRDHIFSKINEQRFSVLYSNKASRPNAPVNILVGLLFLKEINGWTDEEVIFAFYLDYRVRFALGVTDFENERLCINTITNFRNRIYNHELQTNEDLLQQEVDNLTAELIKASEMDTSQARQDSMMISANCKKMSRLGIIYTVNSNMIKVLLQTNTALLPSSCQHYLEEKDKSNQLYRLKKEGLKSKTEQLLGESLDLLDAVPENLQATRAFQNLIRLLDEQTRQTSEGVAPKENKEISSSSLQNPSEPDATYRKKNKKASIGYVLNVVEARDKEKKLSMIIHPC